MDTKGELRKPSELILLIFQLTVRDTVLCGEVEIAEILDSNLVGENFDQSIGFSMVVDWRAGKRRPYLEDSI